MTTIISDHSYPIRSSTAATPTTHSSISSSSSLSSSSPFSNSNSNSNSNSGVVNNHDQQQHQNQHHLVVKGISNRNMVGHPGMISPSSDVISPLFTLNNHHPSSMSINTNIPPSPPETGSGSTPSILAPSPTTTTTNTTTSTLPTITTTSRKAKTTSTTTTKKKPSSTTAASTGKGRGKGRGKAKQQVQVQMQADMSTDATPAITTTTTATTTTTTKVVKRKQASSNLSTPSTASTAATDITAFPATSALKVKLPTVPAKPRGRPRKIVPSGDQQQQQQQQMVVAVKDGGIISTSIPGSDSVSIPTPTLALTSTSASKASLGMSTEVTKDSTISGTTTSAGSGSGSAGTGTGAGTAGTITITIPAPNKQKPKSTTNSKLDDNNIIIKKPPKPRKSTAGAPRLHDCNHCTKSFARKSDLVRHVRTHLNDKPFICEICQKSFIQASALRVHERTHTGERPYACPHCDKCFADSSSLVRHKRVHTGERPYLCGINGCGRTFCRNVTLLKHQLREHDKQVCKQDGKPYLSLLSKSKSRAIGPRKVGANGTGAKPKAKSKANASANGAGVTIKKKRNTKAAIAAANAAVAAATAAAASSAAAKGPTDSDSASMTAVRMVHPLTNAMRNGDIGGPLDAEMMDMHDADEYYDGPYPSYPHLQHYNSQFSIHHHQYDHQLPYQHHPAAAAAVAGPSLHPAYSYAHGHHYDHPYGHPHTYSSGHAHIAYAQTQTQNQSQAQSQTHIHAQQRSYPPSPYTLQHPQGLRSQEYHPSQLQQQQQQYEHQQQSQLMHGQEMYHHLPQMHSQPHHTHENGSHLHHDQRQHLHQDHEYARMDDIAASASSSVAGTYRESNGPFEYHASRRSEQAYEQDQEQEHELGLRSEDNVRQSVQDRPVGNENEINTITTGEMESSSAEASHVVDQEEVIGNDEAQHKTSEDLPPSEVRRSTRQIRKTTAKFRGRPMSHVLRGRGIKGRKTAQRTLMDLPSSPPADSTSARPIFTPSPPAAEPIISASPALIAGTSSSMSFLEHDSQGLLRRPDNLSLMIPFEHGAGYGNHLAPMIQQSRSAGPRGPSIPGSPASIRSCVSAPEVSVFGVAVDGIAIKAPFPLNVNDRNAITTMLADGNGASAGNNSLGDAYPQMLSKNSDNGKVNEAGRMTPVSLQTNVEIVHADETGGSTVMPFEAFQQPLGSAGGPMGPTSQQTIFMPSREYHNPHHVNHLISSPSTLTSNGAAHSHHQTMLQQHSHQNNSHGPYPTPTHPNFEHLPTPVSAASSFFSSAYSTADRHGSISTSAALSPYDQRHFPSPPDSAYTHPYGSHAYHYSQQQQQHQASHQPHYTASSIHSNSYANNSLSAAYPHTSRHQQIFNNHESDQASEWALAPAASPQMHSMSGLYENGKSQGRLETSLLPPPSHSSFSSSDHHHLLHAEGDRSEGPLTASKISTNQLSSLTGGPLVSPSRATFFGSDLHDDSRKGSLPSGAGDASPFEPIFKMELGSTKGLAINSDDAL